MCIPIPSNQLRVRLLRTPHKKKADKTEYHKQFFHVHPFQLDCDQVCIPNRETSGYLQGTQYHVSS